MTENRWNQDIQLHTTDRLFKALLEPLVPRFVRPNHFTVLRLLLIGPVVYLLATEQLAFGMSLFVLAALTDWFDGALARTRRQITEWGVLYDPLVDKLLIGSVLFVFVLQHVNFMLGFGLLGIEALMVLAAWWQKRRGIVEPANVWGKLKMVAEVCGILLLLFAHLLNINLLVDLSTGTLGLAFIFALVSILFRIR